jgi:hypothetical protein
MTPTFFNHIFSLISSIHNIIVLISARFRLILVDTRSSSMSRALSQLESAYGRIWSSDRLSMSQVVICEIIHC